MIKDKIKELEKLQGSVSDEKQLRSLVVTAIIGMVCLLFLCYGNIPSWMFRYFVVAGILIAIRYVCMYFYKKRDKAYKRRKLKKVLYFCSLFFMYVGVFPILLLEKIWNILVRKLKKEFVMKNNIFCSIVEIVYYAVFAVFLVEQTILYHAEITKLFATYTVAIIFEIVFKWFVRKVLIRGKYCYYERYRYKEEMNVVSEYVFLSVAILSTFYSASDYELVFLPIVFWYSIKQVKSYRKERKNSDFTRKFLLEILNELEEIYSVYLETEITDKLVMRKYLDVEKIKYYQKYNENKGVILSKGKKIQNTIMRIENLSKEIYNMPKKKEQLKNELVSVMNDIVKYLKL